MQRTNSESLVRCRHESYPSILSCYQVFAIHLKFRHSIFKWVADTSFKCHDDVIKWTHFPRYCLFERGIHRSPASVKRSFGVFFDLRLDKRLCKQERRRWFGTPTRSLWCLCNGKIPGKDMDATVACPITYMSVCVVPFDPVLHISCQVNVCRSWIRRHYDHSGSLCHYVGLSRGNPWPGQTSLSSCRLFAFLQVSGHLSQISQLAAHPGGASRTGEQRSTEVNKGLLSVSLPAGDDRQLRAPIAGLNVFCFGWNTVRHYSCMNYFVVKMENLSPIDMYVF